MPNCMKQNIAIYIFFSSCISILGTVFAITWSSFQYFILTGFMLTGFLFQIYNIYKIYKAKNYIAVPVQCKMIKKNQFDQANATFYFKKENGETLTLRLNKYLHTIELEQKYIIYFEKDDTGSGKNYIGIEQDKEVI